MSLHFFTVPALDSAAAEAEFNAFCRQYRLLRIGPGVEACGTGRRSAPPRAAGRSRTLPGSPPLRGRAP